MAPGHGPRGRRTTDGVGRHRWTTPSRRPIPLGLNRRHPGSYKGAGTGGCRWDRGCGERWWGCGEPVSRCCWPLARCCWSGSRWWFRRGRRVRCPPRPAGTTWWGHPSTGSGSTSTPSRCVPSVTATGSGRSSTSTRGGSSRTARRSPTAWSCAPAGSWCCPGTPRARGYASGDCRRSGRAPRVRRARARGPRLRRAPPRLPVQWLRPPWRRPGRPPPRHGRAPGRSPAPPTTVRRPGR